MKVLFICLLLLFSAVSATAAAPALTPDNHQEKAWQYTNGVKYNAAVNDDLSRPPIHGGTSLSSTSGSGVNYGLGLVNVLGQSALDSLGGKLRMQFMVNDDSKLMGEADFLLPLYDTAYSSVFAQIGVRSVWDDRWNANFGIGQRWYPQARETEDGSIDSGAWMVGYNAFFDYDLTRSHQRGGIGVEGRYDMITLSSNYYFPLSGWRDAKGSDPLLDSYLERPAEGWDVRLRGELPFYRELALTGAYSQWLGDEVGVFGASDREKNPKVWSYGLEYTPVPLVTLYAGQSRTEQGRSENTFGLRFTYAFGSPFEDAVTPAKREGQRPQVDRRDFVDRENRIVLAYKQKEKDEAATAVESQYALALTAPNRLEVEEDCLITATLTDNGVPVANARIIWSIVSGTGTLSTTSSKTGGKGKGRTTFTATDGGPVTVRASYEPDSGVTITKDIELFVAWEAPHRLL